MAAAERSEPLEAALDELYGVEPADFVDTRKRLAAALRTAGEKDAAKLLAGARRPTTAAWVLNQLRRREPALIDSFLDRSRELEAAQAGALSGGRDAMREATKVQREALGAVTDAALAMLETRATDAYRTQIRSTLQAASSDDAVGEQLQEGRLLREVVGSTGFPDVPGLALVPDLEPRTAPKPRPQSRRPKRAERDDQADGGADATSTTDQAAKAERERLHQERAAARAEQAELRRVEAEAAWHAAQEAADGATTEAAAAHRRIGELERDLEAARREARVADNDAARAGREAARLARTATKLRARAAGSDS